MSWYKTKRQFTKKELAYIHLLQKTFLVQDQYKNWIPYQMTDYQKEYHADSVNIQLEDSKDILFIKARGISFTWSTLIDLIISGLTFSDIVIPIIAQREGTAEEHVQTAQKIISNCLVEEIKRGVTFTKTSINFKNTGSKIMPFPSSSAADAVRGLRLITGLIDEFAFQANDNEILASFGDAIQGDLGQIKIGSTPCGRNNKFFELVSGSRTGEDIGFKVYELPVFDPNIFNSEILPSSQPNLVPIAPWISMKKIDGKWKRDRNIFLQENMCFSPDTLVYVDGKFIKIKDVVVGQKTIDADGKITIVKGITKRKYRGKVQRISIFNGGEIVCTPEHPILIGEKKNKKIIKQDYLDARNVKTNDFLKFPRLQSNDIELDVIDLRDYITKPFLDNGKILYYKTKWAKTNSARNVIKKGLKYVIPLNKDVLRFFGLFLAEGGFDSNGKYIGLSFNENENELIKEVLETLKKYFGVIGRVLPNGKGCKSVTVGNIFLNEIFITFFGKGAKEKHFPPFSDKLSKEQKIWMLDGFYDGDGYRDGKVNSAVSVSKKLIEDIRKTLLGMNVYSYNRIASKKGQFLIQNRLCNCSEKYDLRINGQNKERFDSIVENRKEVKLRYLKGVYGEDFDWLRVRSNEVEDYEGFVYNLETESHSYLTEIGIVHNCDFLDDSLSYIPYKFVSRCNSEDIENLKESVFTIPGFKYQSKNPVVFGHDYAEKSDFASVVGYEILPTEPPFFKQIYLDYFKGKSIPEQEMYVQGVIEAFPSLMKYRIDMTGPGIGLLQHAKRQFGHIIDGIDFRTSVRTSESMQKHSIRKFMITNFKALVENDQINLISDPLQTTHITSIDYSFQVPRDNKTGHADILFANCLACLPMEYRNVGNEDMVTGKTIQVVIPDNQPNGSVIIINNEGEQRVMKNNAPKQEETWEQKLKRLQTME